MAELVQRIGWTCLFPADVGSGEILRSLLDIHMLMRTGTRQVREHHLACPHRASSAKRLPRTNLQSGRRPGLQRRRPPPRLSIV
ncbi:hypothetical protein BQ8794_240179 [Mesorhizobium prunaredense]|uniref:Uncharacterized protein n=1 Tax=Mesorhizobium prunaredense TaxID=1631249 RepID=A0A1R3V821_9HYPH|nr:hypothetical protein BQ8794_240179 [Mesorhizobium prunaredense]